MELMGVSRVPFRAEVRGEFSVSGFSLPVRERQCELQFLQMASGSPSLQMGHSPSLEKQRQPAVEEVEKKVSSSR